jgi:uncharacterized iron-regulated protein
MISPWTDTTGQPIAHQTLMAEIAQAQVVALGEQHDRADHHLWQLHVASSLLAHRPIVMGFEMFPARLTPVLAQWVAGDLSETEFLDRAEWQRSWGFAAELYMPLFRFCRDMRVPMIGLNVDRALVRAVGASGWDAVADDAREGLTPARPSPLPYRQFIFDLTGGARPDRAARSASDPAFDRFVRAQEVWDRAFATHIAAVANTPDAPLVVGIIGKGHLQFGGGVQWQLADLGVLQARALITIDADAPLPPPSAADGVFRLQKRGEG